MPRINLLPWREEQRKEQRRQFGGLAVLAALLTLAVLFYAHLHLGRLIDHQVARNDYLKKEIAILDQRIAQIKTLEETRAKLQARIDIIQELQLSRPHIVHLFDALARTLPEGVYLTSIAQKGPTLTLAGIAQSNARVSSYMHNLERSEWVGTPYLDIIEAKGEQSSARANEFTLRVTRATTATTDAATPAATTADAGASAKEQQP